MDTVMRAESGNEPVKTSDRSTTGFVMRALKYPDGPYAADAAWRLKTHRVIPFKSAQVGAKYDGSRVNN